MLRFDDFFGGVSHELGVNKPLTVVIRAVLCYCSSLLVCKYVMITLINDEDPMN